MIDREQYKELLAVKDGLYNCLGYIKGMTEHGDMDKETYLYLVARIQKAATTYEELMR